LRGVRHDPDERRAAERYCFTILTKFVTAGDLSRCRWISALPVASGLPCSSWYETPSTCTCRIDDGTTATPKPADTRFAADEICGDAMLIDGAKPAA